MHKLFVDTSAVSGNTVTVVGDDAYHIARSLRMAVGDSVTVSDTDGKEYLCTLTRIRDEECIAEIVSVSEGKGEPPYPLTLYMAYPKGDKLETVIQKAVELGATEVVPFLSSRCIKRPGEEKADKLAVRLSRIALEAAKQCGRGKVPTVGAVLSFDKMLAAAKEKELAFLCYEDEHALTLKEALPASAPKSVAVIVGSEGGFSPEEAAAARAAGILTVGLGERILRCETAPAYVLSALSYVFEL